MTEVLDFIGSVLILVGLFGMFRWLLVAGQRP